jgi:hypothetical protein
MNRDSCETCALAASISQVETEDDMRGEKIYAEFRRRNKKSNRIIDIGGSDAATLFCALGSRHFKNGGTKCKHWIPALDFTISDALSIHLSRKMTLLTYIIIALTISMLVLMVYPILKEPHYVIEVSTKNMATTIDNNRHDESKKTVNAKTSQNNNQKPVSDIEQPKPKTVIPAAEKHGLPPNQPVQQTP